MKTTRDFRPLTDRDHFDTGPCSFAAGFAPIETRQDAPYHGAWCSPGERTIVEFSEGDLSTTVCESDAEFVAEIRKFVRWADEAGYGPAKIEALFHDELRGAFEALGVADLLH